MSNSYFQKIGKGPDLLILHGWQHDGASWVNVVEKLKNDFTCWLIDLPGFGENSEQLDSVSPMGYAKWVHEFAASQGLKKYHLLGHSFGGRIALVLAADYSEVEKLIVYAAPAFKTQPAKGLISKLVSEKLKIRNIPYLSKLLRSKDYQEAGDLKEVFLKAVNYDLTPHLAKINVPTLILWGENDTEVPLSVAERLKGALKNSKLKVMPRATHLAHLENPNLFSGIVRDFLKFP